MRLEEEIIDADSKREIQPRRAGIKLEEDNTEYSPRRHEGREVGKKVQRHPGPDPGAPGGGLHIRWFLGCGDDIRR